LVEHLSFKLNFPPQFFLHIKSLMKVMRGKGFLFISLLIISLPCYSQTDTLILKNNDLIIGEIKSMDKGILGIETDYSDQDFKISWLRIKRIISPTNYLITLSDGRRYNGKIKSLNDSIIEIDTYLPEAVIKFSKKTENVEKPQDNRVEVESHEIVYLNALDEKFWSRLSLYIDIGTDITKANDLRQFTINTGTGYLADRWKSNITFNNLRSSQAKTEPIKRTEFAGNFNFFLPKDWFVLYNLNMLSNTEQLLDLRTSNMIGMGKYLIHSNQTYFAFQGGLNLNNEKFQKKSSIQSGELFLGAQYNVYDIGDLDLITTAVIYPSLTEKRRFRTDFKVDIRYEFKFDLFFKIGSSLNYDNQPTEGASKTDYIFQTTVGWKL
jgi:putative salt-induced outer membrane protein YdiY